jgi:hypothetical protein
MLTLRRIAVVNLTKIIYQEYQVDESVLINDVIQFVTHTLKKNIVKQVVQKL